MTPADLTRRRDQSAAREGWLIYFGDVRVGAIGQRSGVPNHAPQWGWSCGFYPGIEPGQHRSGITATFEEARAGFQDAWQELAARRTEGDYEAWREQRDWTAWKYRMQASALPLPTQRSDGIARCFCGAVISNPSLDPHIRTAHRLTE